MTQPSVWISRQSLFFVIELLPRWLNKEESGLLKPECQISKRLSLSQQPLEWRQSPEQPQILNPERKPVRFSKQIQRCFPAVTTDGQPLFLHKRSCWEWLTVPIHKELQKRCWSAFGRALSMPGISYLSAEHTKWHEICPHNNVGLSRRIWIDILFILSFGC